MYPEQLRELRAQYPNTQFDGHGRVIGGTPLNQYNAQSANPAAIPASVRTYSQFDPATGTWVRHTNGAASVQSPAPVSAPAQGTPINFQQVLGYTPAGFEGATLNVGGRANAQPRQVMRPLARGNARDVSAAVAPRDLGYGVTAQTTGTYDYSKTHGNENPVAPLTQPGVVYPPARNLEGYDPNNPPVVVNAKPREIVLDPMFAPGFDSRAIDYSQGTDAKRILDAQRTIDDAGQFLTNALMTTPVGLIPAAFRAIPGTVSQLGRYAGTAGNTARTLGQGAMATARNVGAKTGKLVDRIVPDNLNYGARYLYDQAVNLGKGLYNRLGGFLRRPVTPEEAATQAQQAAYQQAADIGARVRAGQYYTH